MITLWEGLFARLGLKRVTGRRSYAFDESLATEVVELAKLEQMPAEELLADIVATGLRQRRTGSMLKDRWESLSPREQEVTALAWGGVYQPSDSEKKKI